jgi:protease IV
MREFFKMFFASLLAMIVMCFIAVGLVVASIVGISKMVSDKKEKKVAGNILVVDLSKAIHEQGTTNSLSFLDKGSAYDNGLYDIMKCISHAKTDAAIKGILIKSAPSPNGWATLQQLRMALADFKKSGKFIYAYGEDITQGAYFVSSVADSIYLNPVGNVDLKGFATVLAFFKGTLDKLELQPQIFYAGKFKSATEPFRYDKMSEPNRLQIQVFQNSMWDQYLEAVSQYTHADKASINDLAVKGSIMFPTDAVKHGLVAGLLYWDEVENRLYAKAGLKNRSDIKYVGINEYDGYEKAEEKASANRIAVIFAEGNIVDGEQKDDREIASRTLCEEIRKVADNDKIKAVVLRVNSPGGSGLASDVILRELDLLKQKKHLIVSMGDYAASGGYFIACRADSIFALPNTITGSIGVFGMMFGIDKMMKDKLGVTFDEVKNAPYADFPTGTRQMTPEEAQRMQTQIDTFYSMFKGRVASGRRMTVDNVDSIAQGRVWTGTDAIKIGLVDELGGLDRAIASAATMAKVKDYKVVTYPEPEDKFNMLLRKFHNNGASVLTKEAIKAELGADYQWYERLQELRGMNGKVMMAMPFVPKVN